MLELGAGAGLPSIVAAILGARKVVVTDFPDEDLISNLTLNIESCKLLAENRRNITAQVGLSPFSPRRSMLNQTHFLGVSMGPAGQPITFQPTPMLNYSAYFGVRPSHSC